MQLWCEADNLTWGVVLRSISAGEAAAAADKARDENFMVQPENDGWRDRRWKTMLFRSLSNNTKKLLLFPTTIKIIITRRRSFGYCLLAGTLTNTPVFWVLSSMLASGILTRRQLLTAYLRERVAQIISFFVILGGYAFDLEKLQTHWDKDDSPPTQSRYGGKISPKTKKMTWVKLYF